MKLQILFVIFTFFGMRICFELTPEKNGRLYGGQDIDIKAAKYMVQLEKNGEFICGATIIGPKFVLTAAHCLKENSHGDANFTMRFGTTSLQKGGSVLPVEKIKKHPKYNPKTNDYDVAVIELDEPLKYNDSVNCLKVDKEKEKDVKMGALVKTAGWGKSRIGGRFEKTLKTINMTVAGREACFKHYLGRTTARNICVRERGVALCKGDAGNPLGEGEGEGLKLIGVASKIPFLGCNGKGSPSVFTYTKNPEIFSFLTDTVKGMC